MHNLPARVEATLVAALCLLSLLLVVLRWQFAPPGEFVLDVGDTSAGVSHFYTPEESEDVRFRWSRSLSAATLPALASSQVITVTANPARQPGSAPARFRLLSDTTVIAEYVAAPGWNPYTATTGPRLAPDLRLMIESDTFYPSQSDRRKLGIAVSTIVTAPQGGRLGWTLPPFLWLIGSLLWPLLGYAASRAMWRGVPFVTAAVCAIVPLIAALLLPATAVLPLFAWATGLAALAVVLLVARDRLDRDSRASIWLARLSSSRWELPAVGALITGLAVIFTWPLVTRLGDSLPGWPGDNFAFLYKFWWFRTALLETHQWPLFDPNVFAPFGFNLGQGEPTLSNTLPGVVLGALFGDVASYNLISLLSFVISGLGGYLLVKETAGSRRAGVLGAVAFAFCPYRMSQFAGHIQLLGTGWIALAFYFVERSLKTGRWTSGLFAGVSLALAALSAWYYAYMVGLVLGLYVLLRVWTLRHEVLWLGLLRPLLAGLAAFVLVTGPVALPSLALARGGQLSHSAKAADEHSAAPVDYIIPNELHPIWGEPALRAHANQNVIESALYLGVVPVAMAIFGWILARRRDDKRSGALRLCWLVVGAVAFVLSLGLTLHDTGGQVTVMLGGVPTPVTLPGQLLYDWLPLFSSMRAYARFGLLVALAVFVLMGMGWAEIVRQRPRHANWFTLLALVALLADFWTAPYAWGTARVTPTQTSQYLAAAPPGAIMQMPLTSALTGPALFAETWYGKPIAYGYDTFEPAEWRAARPVLANFPEDDALDVLHDWGVRYIVVSANAYGPDWPGTLDFLKSLPRLRYLTQFTEQRAWDVDPAVLDARPDAEDYLAPDTFAIFELQS